MADIRPFPKTDTKEEIEALLLCPNCNAEMCLYGIEPESDVRDLHTFVCSACDAIEVRGVRVNKAPPVVIVAANGKSSSTTRTRRSLRAK